MAVNQCAITIGQQQTCIAGATFQNSERIAPAQLAEMFSDPMPVEVDADGSAAVGDVARYLRKVGVAGLREMLASEIVQPKTKKGINHA